MKTRIRRNAGRLTRQAGKPDLRGQADRDGSVIVVVLALLIGLLLLGILLFTDSSQEEINAEYFAGSAKVRESGLDADTIFGDILRQIILGANDRERHSPFYGGRNSLLPGMYGRWTTPFSGEGVRVILNGSNVPIVDQDYDPTTTEPAYWMHLNQSVAAQYQIDPMTGQPVVVDRAIGTSTTPGSLAAIPAPNVPYSYFDHTSPYLAYDSHPNARVLIPSYMRPALLRHVPVAEWYSNAATAGLSMRPHKKHLAILSNGQIARVGGVPVRRYVSDEQTQAGVASFPFPAYGAGSRVHGVWSGNGNNYILDEDLDGDGVKESIYLDMDLGLFTTPDGTKKYVPIVSVRMISLDGTVNLNGAGNVARGYRPTGSVPLAGANEFLHRSNDGVSRSEINAAYGLLANIPGAMSPDLEQHRYYYGGDPATQRQLANMEYWWLLTGRPQYQGSKTNILSLYTGKWGDPQQMRAAQATPGPDAPATPFPGPGVTLTDDAPLNNLQGDNQSGLGVFPAYVVLPRYVHPLDFRGTGRYYGGTGATQRMLTAVGRHQFPSYSNYYLNTPGWPTSLFTGGSAGVQLIDEPGEMRLDQPSSSDSPFTSGETVSLHMSDSDRAAAGRDGDRILQLALYNFLKNPLAATIRRLYTTESWDALSYGKVFYRYGSEDSNRNGVLDPGEDTNLNGVLDGASLRLWEHSNTATAGVVEFPPLGTLSPGADGKPGRAGIDDDGNGIIDDPSELGWPGSDDATDPFRPELRELLGHQPGNTATNSKPLMRKLSVNGVLDRATLNGPLRFRPLTPHPTGVDATGIPLLGQEPVSGPSSILGDVDTRKTNLYRPEQIDPALTDPTAPPTRYHQQEWLARYDRQRLCRDIYVMLYMFGGGKDINYRATSTATGTVYSAAQLKEMAQFAVNLVDALDPDDVITAFEYDTDLSDGWGLDDDPYTADATTEPALASMPSQWGLVFGVERQQLAFSEALAILSRRTKDTSGTTDMDHAATDYDDSRNHLFSYLELQNTTPAPVAFNGNWQIVVKDNRFFSSPPTVTPATPFFAERRLTLLPHTANGVSAPDATDTASRFTIATQDDKDYIDLSTSNVKPSYFLVNPGYDDVTPTGFVRCAPAGNPDLDLMIASSNSTTNPRYRLTTPRSSGTQIQPTGTYIEEGPAITGAPPSDPAGKRLLELVTATDPNDPATYMAAIAGQFDDPSLDTAVVRVQLRRRLHPNRVAPVTHDSNPGNHATQSNDNPWIGVDEMLVPMRTFHLATTDTKGMNLRTQLKRTKSLERIQPLNANVDNYPIDPPDPPMATQVGLYALNSLGTVNARTTANLPGGTFTLWQPHFDRDFASATELLGIPLYGPDQTTQNAFTEDTNEDGVLDPSTEDINGNGVIDYGFGLGTGATNSTISHRGTAAMRFLRPHLPGGGVSASNPNPENRWYRLFNFVEVPDPNPASNPWYVDVLGNFGAVQRTRTPAKIDLNTMSHVSQLAALLDDTDVFPIDQTNLHNEDLNGNFTLDPGEDRNGNGVLDTVPFLKDSYATPRFWWNDFLSSRDGEDPVTRQIDGVTGLPIPGTGLKLPGVPPKPDENNPRLGSNPFRDLSYALNTGTSYNDVNNPYKSMESTVLRTRPGDSTFTGRRLFELGQPNQTTGIDYTTRYRLLPKVLNNSTNRSNVFLITIKIDFFEAIELTPDNPPASNPTEKVVRIGDKLPGTLNPGYLAYYVVDRTKALLLLSQNDLPKAGSEDTNGNGVLDPGEDLNGNGMIDPRFTWSFRQDMDFSSLILHKQRIK